MTDLLPDLFDDFWEAYPRKVSKKAARTAFDKLDEPSQRAAIADVQKRARFRAWSHNKKLIPHAATFLNAERWEDDWQSEMKPEREDMPNTGPYMPQPKPEPEREFSLAEIQINKAFKNYLMAAGGLGERDRARDEDYQKQLIAPALAIKHDLMGTLVPALREDVEAGITDKARAAVEVIDMFLSRMDRHYGLQLKERVWRQMRS